MTAMRYRKLIVVTKAQDPYVSTVESASPTMNHSSSLTDDEYDYSGSTGVHGRLFRPRLIHSPAWYLFNNNAHRTLTSMLL